MKKSNWDLLKEEEKKYKDTLVLNMFEMVLFRGVIDWEDDYYYQYENLEWEISESSCVVGFIPLKWSLPTKDYLRLSYWWGLNTQNPIIRLEQGDVLRSEKEWVLDLYFSGSVKKSSSSLKLFQECYSDFSDKVEKVIFHFDKNQNITSRTNFYKLVLAKLRKDGTEYEVKYWDTSLFQSVLK